MTESAVETFSITRNVRDDRAEGGMRVVHVSASQILIERVYAGVRMKVAVPVAAYRGLVVSVCLQAATASLRLRHADADLDVNLETGDAITVAKTAKAWGTLLRKPITIEEVGAMIGTPFGRQRHRPKPSRRSRFARNRRVGDPARLQVSVRGEREIIART